MEDVLLILIVLFFLVLVIFFFYMAAKMSKQKRQIKQETELKMRDSGALEYGTFKHVVGLPLAENTSCDFYYCEDRITIEGGGSTFNLSLSKVIDLTMTTDVEIQKAYVSSAGGAVAGGLIFGPLGALVGGRAKQKKTTTITYYLVVTYDKDGTPDYISFDIDNNFTANKIVSTFKERPKETREEIEL